MAQRKRRWGVLAFVSVALVVAALLSFSPSAWATPAQRNAQQQTVPIKTVNVDSACPGDQIVFTITWNSGSEASYDVVFTDQVKSYLQIDEVWASRGTVSIVGQLITVDVGDLAANTTVTIKITLTVLDCAPLGVQICNTVVVNGEGFEQRWEEEGHCCVDPCQVFVPEPGSLLLLASGLAGLLGYGGLRWAKREV